MRALGSKTSAIKGLLALGVEFGGFVEFSGDGGFGSSVAEAPSTLSPTSNQATFPSRAPEIAAYVSLGVSLLLTTRLRAVLPVPAVDAATSLGIAVAGYVLTPFAVVFALVWARADGIRRQLNPWFDVLGLASQLRRLQIIALLSFVIAFDHVTTIATWATARIG
jgi:hypothetical protein